MGHTVLAVPAPALEPFVRERTARYDASFVSADPAFSHAHLTILAPWLPSPTAADLDRIGLRPPELVADLPAGGTRLLQHADGYVATIKRGVVTAAEGALTGERPGRLQRGPQR